MTFLVATVVFPVLLLVLAVGAGLLLERATGRELPGVLLPTLGLAVLVVTTELFAFRAFSAPLIPYAVMAVAVLGFALGWRRIRKPDGWALGAGVVTYVMVALPVLAAGRPTLAAFLLDTTVGIHLASAEHLIEHARDFDMLEPSSYRFYLENYIGTRYPTGGQTLLAGVGRLTGQELIWLYQPLLSALIAFCAPVLYFLARAAQAARPLAAIAGVLAAAPALVYAYAQMGAIKEIAVVPFTLLLGALIVLAPSLLRAGWRGLLPLAVVGAAGMGAIGVAFLPWFGLACLAMLGFAVVEVRERRLELGTLAKRVLVLALALVVLALPTLGPLSDTLRLTEGLAQSNAVAAADPGNLLRPLREIQVFGIWLGGSHRVDPPPERALETWALIGVAALAAAFGALYLIRRRLWALAAFVASSGIVWWVLTAYGKDWTDAKILMITSPVVVLLACIGGVALVKAGRRAEGAIVIAAIAVGVLGSNAYSYHETNLAPTDRIDELVEIGHRFSGEGPTLVPDFDEYALYGLREDSPDIPGVAYKPERLAYSRGGATAYGATYDLDALTLDSVLAYPTLVLRRSPDRSRPPVNYRRAFEGRWYEVWRRTDAPPPLVHVSAGRGRSPSARPACADVRDAAAVARAAGGKLVASVRAPEAELDLERAVRSPAWQSYPFGIGLMGPGGLEADFDLATSGPYRVWLRGDFSRAVDVTVDGERIGSVAYESGGDGNYAEPLPATLEAGRHRLRLQRGGGSLRPGDAAPSRLVYVVVAPDADWRLINVPPSRWRELCARRVDWVEAVPPSA